MKIDETRILEASQHLVSTHDEKERPSRVQGLEGNDEPFFCIS